MNPLNILGEILKAFTASPSNNTRSNTGEDDNYQAHRMAQWKAEMGAWERQQAAEAAQRDYERDRAWNNK